MALMNRPAPVEVTYKMRFLMTHNPTNGTLNKFKEGVRVLDWPFDDGAPLSNQIADDWLSLVKIKFREEPGCRIAVHCVTGLGRAPVLVALALTEGGMKYEAAVQFIRQKRRGAFNGKQLWYLGKFHPKVWLCFKDSNGHRNNCCIQ
nr:protein tyrosine phosphatase type IVA 1-like [Rattus norvegicus]